MPVLSVARQRDQAAGRALSQRARHCARHPVRFTALLRAFHQSVACAFHRPVCAHGQHLPAWSRQASAGHAHRPRGVCVWWGGGRHTPMRQGALAPRPLKPTHYCMPPPGMIAMSMRMLHKCGKECCMSAGVGALRKCAKRTLPQEPLLAHVPVLSASATSS
eukprot:364079-Chlamydomonas_euryale.AAC.3